jgi:hypothetical protein
MPIPESITIYKEEENIMKRFIKRVFGIDKIEQEAKDARDSAKELEAKFNEVLKTPKEIATEAKEPWVGVLQTHVAKDDLKNGFFELDWNEYFVLQLRTAGYAGTTEEEVVDQWFQELCRNIGNEEGVDMTRRGSGFVNRALRDDGKTEVY